MIYCGITEKDLQKIIINCQTQPFYRVIIACKDDEKLEYCKNILNKLLPQLNTTINLSWYNFLNHSNLLLAKSIYLRGHRCNDLYYNLMEDEEIIETILRPCANLPYNEEIVTRMIEYYKNKGENL